MSYHVSVICQWIEAHPRKGAAMANGIKIACRNSTAAALVKFACGNSGYNVHTEVNQYGIWLYVQMDWQTAAEFLADGFTFRKKNGIYPYVEC